MPKRASNARCCSGGSGADAERAKRSAAARRCLRGRQVGPVEQIGDDRRHDVEPRRPVALDQRPPLRGAEAMRHHDAAAGDERRDGRDALAVDVIERQRRQHAVGGRELVRRARRRARRGRRFACDSSAPFGVPVVPDVYISSAGDRGVERRPSAAASRRQRSRDRRATSARTIARLPISRRDRRAAAPTNSGAANTMRVSRMRERVLDQRVLREQADRRRRHSHRTSRRGTRRRRRRRSGSMYETTSPGATPCAASSRARRARELAQPAVASAPPSGSGARMNGASGCVARVPVDDLADRRSRRGSRSGTVFAPVLPEDLVVGRLAHVFGRERHARRA